jgi:uncharacterized membrane protein YcfT
MVTSGIDPDYGSGPDDPYLTAAIDAAQRAGIVVYSIYYSGAGRWGALIGSSSGARTIWRSLAMKPAAVILAGHAESGFHGSLSGRSQPALEFAIFAHLRGEAGKQARDFRNVKIRAELPHVKLNGSVEGLRAVGAN